MANSPEKTGEPASQASEAAENTGAQPPRQIIVHAQYIKDLSFENPNAPEVLIEPPSPPDVEIGVNVGARNINGEQYEVTLMLSAKAKTEGKALFLVELSYCAIVSAPGVDSATLNPLIMIEAPRLMFPFARAIVSDMTRDGGFMPLSIQPIDFVAVYQSNMAEKGASASNGADKSE